MQFNKDFCEKYNLDIIQVVEKKGAKNFKIKNEATLESGVMITYIPSRHGQNDGNSHNSRIGL